MACFKPLDAWRTPNGQIVFYDSPDTQYQQIPCGQCIGCRMQRANEWALRCMHEASLHKENAFITLTYRPEDLPPDGGLRKKHFQNFMKRLRKHLAPKKIKFYMCGEYGDKNNRPHYHALIFGHDFHDRILYGQTQSGHDLYMSPTLEKLWTHGFVQVGDVTYESAAYVARYIMKKINGRSSDQVDEKTGLKPYERFNDFTGEIHAVLPEYTTMSRGGRDGNGIASDWIARFSNDCYPKDYVTHDGIKRKIPRYYDEKVKKHNPDLIDSIKAHRAHKGYESKDNTPERLATREVVAKAKTKPLIRSL